jgi:hypothetical protein
MDSVFLEVTVPKENTDPNQEAPKKKKISSRSPSSFFPPLPIPKTAKLSHFLDINDYISFEIAAVGKKISFYINAPRKLQPLIEKQLHAQYPKRRLSKSNL